MIPHSDDYTRAIYFISSIPSIERDGKEKQNEDDEERNDEKKKFDADFLILTSFNGANKFGSVSDTKRSDHCRDSLLAEFCSDSQ